MSAITERMLHEGVKALAGVTAGDVECFSPKVLASYEQEVTRTFEAMLQAATPPTVEQSITQLVAALVREKEWTQEPNINESSGEGYFALHVSAPATHEDDGDDTAQPAKRLKGAE